MTLIAVSLLRGPSFPDPSADQGTHSFRFRLTPNTDLLGAVRQGYLLGDPVVSGIRIGEVPALAVSDNPAVIIETVKLADDESGDVVLRLYEAAGTHTRARITYSFATTSVWDSDIYEVNGEPIASDQRLDFHPFQIRTIRVRPIQQPRQ